MLRALNTAATGMAAQQMHIDVTANNMANVNTTGFKRSRAEFQDLLYQTIRAPGGTTGQGTQLPTGIQVGQGTRLVSTEILFGQGTTTQTQNPLDIAIEGQGFFQIQRPNGDIAYSRAGNFKTDAEGRIVTVDGFPLEPQMNVPIDALSLSISPDGVVSATMPNNQSQEVGTIQLASFVNPAGLREMGRSLFAPSQASGEPIVGQPGQDNIGTVAQGFLEGSNVEVVTEMIDLIASQRAYEINQRVIQAADDMLRKTAER
jgi:flagellar basal-body rod protein FlgG